MDTISKMLESHFGPGSGVTNISEFTRSATDEQETSIRELDEWWSAIPQERKVELENECR